MNSAAAGPKSRTCGAPCQRAAAPAFEVGSTYVGLSPTAYKSRRLWIKANRDAFEASCTSFKSCIYDTAQAQGLPAQAGAPEQRSRSHQAGSPVAIKAPAGSIGAADRPPSPPLTLPPILDASPAWTPPDLRPTGCQAGNPANSKKEHPRGQDSSLSSACVVCGWTQRGAPEASNREAFEAPCTSFNLSCIYDTAQAQGPPAQAVKCDPCYLCGNDGDVSFRLGSITYCSERCRNVMMQTSGPSELSKEHFHHFTKASSSQWDPQVRDLEPSAGKGRTGMDTVGRTTGITNALG